MFLDGAKKIAGRNFLSKLVVRVNDWRAYGNKYYLISTHFHPVYEVSVLASGKTNSKR